MVNSVDVGTTLTVVHTPGSVCFVSGQDGVAFTGDHVLEHISPNPLLTVVPGTEDERTRSLPLYLDSLRKIQDVNADVGYAGHGKRIVELDGRVEEILDHHSRKGRIADLI